MYVSINHICQKNVIQTCEESSEPFISKLQLKADDCDLTTKEMIQDHDFIFRGVGGGDTNSN